MIMSKTIKRKEKFVFVFLQKKKTSIQQFLKSKKTVVNKSENKKPKKTKS